MELPTWKGAYCPRHVNPLSVRLFNHARGALQAHHPGGTQSFSWDPKRSDAKLGTEIVINHVSGTGDNL